MLAFVVALALTAQAGQPILRAAEVDTLSTAALAERLLPTDAALEAEGHELRGYRAGYPSVLFRLRPQPIGDELCRHRSVEAFMKPNASDPETVVRERLVPYVQYALDPRCNRNRPDLAVSVPGGAEADLIEVMLRFVSIQNEVRATGAGKADIPCSSTIPSRTDVCAQGGAAIFAAINSADLLHAERIDRTWRIAVMPNGRGQAYWEVRLAQAPDDRRVLRLEWRYPAPF